MKNIENKYGLTTKKDRTFILAARKRARELGRPVVEVKKPKARIYFETKELESMASGDDFSMAAFIKEQAERGVCKTNLKKFAYEMFEKGTFGESTLAKFMRELGMDNTKSLKHNAA